jgi:hypothetical protein
MIIVTDNSILYGSRQEKIETKEEKINFVLEYGSRGSDAGEFKIPIALLLILLGICLLPIQQMIVNKNLQAMVLSLRNLVIRRYSKS